MTRRFEVLKSRTDVENRVADELMSVIHDSTNKRAVVNILVTGGTVGIGTLAAMRRHDRAFDVDWSLVHVWWGDERFVPAGSAERNDQQALDAMFSHVPIPDGNLHAFPADHGQTVEEARDEFLGAHSGGFPEFDVALNGIGPDGHVASLFPHRDHGRNELVIAVHDSPKPPAERLSFTFPILNSAKRVWIVAAGSDKAPAIGQLARGANPSDIPASALSGRDETVIWLDADAAADLKN